jgi:hypothetical protein
MLTPGGRFPLWDVQLCCAANLHLSVVFSPLLPQKPGIRFKIVLKQIFAPIWAKHLEIISSRPLRLAFDLMPAVHHFFDIKAFTLP